MLSTYSKVVLMHYSPIVDTLVGEPESIYPFLGTSRLLSPLEDHGATVVFHGHAHHGSPEGRTPSGIPVWNVALPVLRRLGESIRYRSVPAPERRREGAEQERGGP
jgi:Icc-related predicted phosphoesterase